MNTIEYIFVDFTTVFRAVLGSPQNKQEQRFLIYLLPLLMHVCVCQSLSHVRLSVNPWIAAHQAPLSVEFSRQEYWSWVAISFSNVNFSSSSLVTKLCLTLVTPQTVACHAPLSMGFSRQEYWNGLLFPSPCIPLSTCICTVTDEGGGNRDKGREIFSLITKQPLKGTN